MLATKRYQAVVESPDSKLSIPELLGKLTAQITQLARQEVALAKADLKDSVRSALADSVGVGVGVGLALIGILALVGSGITALSQVLPLWGSFLAVGCVLIAIGTILAYVCKQKVVSDLKLDHVTENLQLDRRMMKEGIREFQA